MSAKLKQGRIQLYTGGGKGKTTAALGLSLRAIGSGFRVYFVQFLKPESAVSGEMNIARRLAPQLKLVRLSDDSFLGRISEEVQKRNSALYAKELDNIKKLMQAGEYDIFILDESVNALNLGLIDWRQIEGLIKIKPPQVELIFTGQPAPPQLIELADLVSNIEMIKHPYQQGVGARAGIEY